MSYFTTPKPLTSDVDYTKNCERSQALFLDMVFVALGPFFGLL